jgi:hypothetical protein
MRLMFAFVALTFLAFSLVGCASGPPSPVVGAEALAFVREAREVGCGPQLDPILGPLMSRPCPCAVRSSGSAETPPAPTPPVAPSAPATPPAPSVPSVAPASTSPPATGPVKGRGGGGGGA